MLDAALLATIRTSLQAQREGLRREVSEHGADPDSGELVFDDDAGFADRSHSSEERSRLIAVVEALRSNLRDVDIALAKLTSGRYGICERCGRSIAAERLEAIPWARLCIDCKRAGG
jgi:RNA polymerase-binding protein DksA